MPTDFAPHTLTSALGGTFKATASTEYSGFPVWKVFDGSNTSYWVSTTNTATLTLQCFDLSNRYTLNNYTIRVNQIPEPNRAPKNWTMEGSNDGSTWTTLDTVTNQTSWTSGETRNFVCDVTTTPYSYFRLNITANNGDSLIQIAELYLYGDAVAYLNQFAPHDLTSFTSHSPIVVSESSSAHSVCDYDGWRAFDGYTDVACNHAWVGTGSGIDYLQIDFGTGHQKLLQSYVIAESDDEIPRYPKDWTVLGSDDGSTWSTLDTVTGSTGWLSNDARAFDCDTATVGYQMFRVSITANNGTGGTNLHTQISELYLYGEDYTPIVEPDPPPLPTSGGSFPTISMGRVFMYPLVRGNARKTTILTFGGTQEEQRWISQRPVADFVLTYTDIDSYSVGILRDFWAGLGGASTSYFDFTLNGVHYDHLVFTNDEFQLKQTKPLRYSVQFTVRQTRSS